MPVLPPRSDYWRTSFYFLASPGVPSEIALSTLLRSPWCSFPSTSFLSATFRRLLYLSFTFAIYPSRSVMDIPRLDIPLIPEISSTLTHLIPACPFTTLFHTALSTLAVDLVHGMLLTSHCRIDFIMSTYLKSEHSQFYSQHRNTCRFRVSNHTFSCWHLCRVQLLHQLCVHIPYFSCMF